MFAQLSPATAHRQRWLGLGSLVLHGLLLSWLLHAPEPLRLTPSSVAFGENGNSVTRIYWPSPSLDNGTHSSSDRATERYKHERLGQTKLIFKASVQLAKRSGPQTPLSPAATEDTSKTQTLSALGHGAQAGFPTEPSAVARSTATRFGPPCRLPPPIRLSIHGNCRTPPAMRSLKSPSTNAVKSQERSCCKVSAPKSTTSA